MLSPRFRLILMTILYSIGLVFAELFQDVENIPHNQYDFIIIGGGTAGSVVANRLTENPEIQVLVLEAGPSNQDVQDVETQIPFLCPDLTKPSSYNWNYTTVPQSGLNNLSIPYPRGHMLGGSSSINWLVYTRGSKEDFDRYANVSGDSGWSWESVLPYFKKCEKWTAPVDYHNTTGQFTPSVHGFNGEVSVSLAGFPSPIDNRIISATEQVDGFEFNEDVNSGSLLGVGWVQSTIKGGERSSAATAYLTSEVLQRKNLHVVVNALVSRVLQTSSGSVPGVRGVEFRSSFGGPLNNVTARQEMLAKTYLITHFAENPWLVNSNDTYETFRRDLVVAAAVLEEWKTYRTGPYTDTVLDHLGFVRVNERLLPDGDTAAGPNSPHYEVIFANGVAVGSPPPEGNFLVGGTVVVSPSSRGSVRLRSNDTFESPLIDPAILRSDTDKIIMREAIRGLFSFFAAAAWDDYVLGPAGAPLANVTDNQSLMDYITANSGTLFHPTGTASMSPRDSTTGVVDPDLKVKKVEGLRVVDVSVLPYVPSAHVQASAYVIGEKASDLIKTEYASD